MTSKKTSERALWLSIWMLILIGGGIYSLWPAGHTQQAALPSTELGPELHRLFENARIVGSTHTRYDAILVLQRRYLASLGRGSKSIRLRYSLQAKSGAAYTDSIQASFDSKTESLKVSVPNPKRIDATQISFAMDL